MTCIVRTCGGWARRCRRALPWCSREGGAPSSACGRGCGLRDQALYEKRPHPALRATFSRRRVKGWMQAEDGPAGWESGIGKSGLRSEEHTSELQSLMRISSAVFCSKKKKLKTNKLN